MKKTEGTREKSQQPGGGEDLSAYTTSMGGYTTATRWGGATAILVLARRVFLARRCFLCYSFDFFGALTSSLLLSFYVYISFLPFVIFTVFYFEVVYLRTRTTGIIRAKRDSNCYIQEKKN